MGFASLNSSGFGAFLDIVGASMLGMVVWLYFVVPHFAWKKLAADEGLHRKISATNDGLRIVTQHSTAIVRWTAYSETIESKTMYLLRRGRFRAYLYIPKAAFRSVADEQEFRRLTSANMRARFS